MNFVIDQALAALPDQDMPTTLLRFVDDLFLTFPSEVVAQSLFDLLNAIHPSIRFKLELEFNSALAFPDVLIAWDLNKQAQTSVFRKAIHTGLYMKFYSFVPNHFKRNLVTCLL